MNSGVSQFRERHPGCLTSPDAAPRFLWSVDRGLPRPAPPAAVDSGVVPHLVKADDWDSFVEMKAVSWRHVRLQMWMLDAGYDFR
jgi:hypothetical protein